MRYACPPPYEDWKKKLRVPAIIVGIILVALCYFLVVKSYGNVAQQKIEFRVAPINEIFVSNNLSYWTITTNCDNAKLFGRVTSGDSIRVMFEAPKEGISKGYVTLTSTPKCLVENISRVVEKRLEIYILGDFDNSVLEFFLID